MKNKNYPRILLKFWKDNGKVTVYPYSNRIRRAMARIRHGHFVKCYCRVEYGKGDTFFEEKISYSDGSTTSPSEMRYNDATFLDKAEALETTKAFWEET